MCNLSEVYPNTLVSVENADGESFEFRPSLSMMDGRVVETDDVYDFTLYEDQVSREYMYDMV